MIIIFFHVLYYLGKYVLEKYRIRRNLAICPKGLVFKDPYESSFDTDDEEFDEEEDVSSENSYTLDFCSAGDDANYLRYLRKHCDFRPKNPDEVMEEEATNANIRFNPPAYLQRYLAVADALEKGPYAGKLKKIVDFGCSELHFFRYLKMCPGVEEILLVDIDRTTLELYKDRVKPLHCDYLHRRTRPLNVKVFEGSVTSNDKHLENVDAVTGIELIEHLYEDTLNSLPANIFGFMKPKVVIVTTPNADFNVLFPNMQGFRHYDHKFEWTRKEFQDWAAKILRQYPEYDVSFEQICYGPVGTENLGGCSQMAIFLQKTPINSHQSGVEGLLKLVESFDYPYEVDNRTDEQKILDDAVYYIRQISGDNESDYTEEVPLSMLKFRMKNFPNISDELLIEILRSNDWNVEIRANEAVILIPALSVSNFSDHSLEDDILNDEYPPDYEGYRNEPTRYNLNNSNWVEERWSGSNSPASIENEEAVNSDLQSSIPSINLNDIAIEDRSQDITEYVDPSLCLSSFTETDGSNNSSNFIHEERNIRSCDSGVNVMESLMEDTNSTSHYCTATSFTALSETSRIPEMSLEHSILDSPSHRNGFNEQLQFTSSPQPSELLAAKKKKATTVSTESKSTDDS